VGKKSRLKKEKTAAAQRFIAPKPHTSLDTPPIRAAMMLGIALLSVLVFQGATRNQFVEWDDNLYITHNTLIRDLSPAGIRAIFSTFYGGNFHPLTTLSNAIEYRLAGTEPWLYHTTNVALHAANGILVFLFIWLLSCRIETALIVSALFAVHPMHVESVAWASERKDVLYSAFFLLALIFYLKELRAQKKTLWRVLVLISFVCALLSKSAAVVLPVVLLLLDYYEDRRREWRLLWEKSHLFLLSLGFGIVALRSQAAAGAINNLAVYSPIERILIPLHNIFLYLWKSVLPVRLSAFYPFPSAGGPLPTSYYLAPVALIALFFTLMPVRSMRRDWLFGVLFYLINLLLVIQIVSLGQTVSAERYTYVPYIGLFFIVGQFYRRIGERIGKHDKPRAMVSAALLAVVAVFSIVSYQRVLIWRDTYTLFDDAVRKGPPAPVPIKNRGMALYHKENFKDAIADLSRSIELYRDDYEAFLNRGAAFFALGNYSSALADFDSAVRLQPRSADVRVNRGNALAMLKRYDEASEQFNLAINIDPQNGAAHYNRGQLLKLGGDTAGACREWRLAQRLQYEQAHKSIEQFCSN
jgi:protein O-mannosyl-transferase